MLSMCIYKISDWNMQEVTECIAYGCVTFASVSSANVRAIDSNKYNHNSTEVIILFLTIAKLYRAEEITFNMIWREV
jgi:hypothetical protein